MIKMNHLLTYWSTNKFIEKLSIIILQRPSSRGGLEVEQWSDNRTLSSKEMGFLNPNYPPSGERGGFSCLAISAWGVHKYMVPMDPLCQVRPGCVLYVCVS